MRNKNTLIFCSLKALPYCLPLHTVLCLKLHLWLKQQWEKPVLITKCILLQITKVKTSISCNHQCRHENEGNHHGKQQGWNPPCQHKSQVIRSYVGGTYNEVQEGGKLISARASLLPAPARAANPSLGAAGAAPFLSTVGSCKAASTSPAALTAQPLQGCSPAPRTAGGQQMVYTHRTYWKFTGSGVCFRRGISLGASPSWCAVSAQEI